MANRLKMAKVHAIQVLRSRGWSQRRIARELGVHRDTVARHAALRIGLALASSLPSPGYVVDTLAQSAALDPALHHLNAIEVRTHRVLGRVDQEAGRPRE